MKKALLSLSFSLLFLPLFSQILDVTGTNDTTICGGDSVLLEATITGGTAPYTLQWFPADSLSCNTCSITLAYPADSTTYMVVATDGNAEIDTAYITVLVNSNDTLSGAGLVGVEVFGSAPSYIADSIIFTLDTSLATDGLWMIDFYAYNRSTISHYGKTYSHTDLYLYDYCTGVKDAWDCLLDARVCFTPLNSCNTYCYDTTVLIGYATGSISQKNTLSVNLYPNPTADKLTVSMAATGSAQLLLYNIYGQQVMARSYPDGFILQELDLGQLPTGNYFLHIISAQGQVVHPVIRK